MRAEIISVGTELLMGEVTNTNARYLSEKLRHLGIDVYYQTTVGDNYNRLEGVIRQGLERSDMVITTGGLGPTTDDITVEVVANSLNLPLVLSEEWLEQLKKITAKFGLQLTENNKKQAYIPKGAIVFNNPRGTAPGVFLETKGKVIISLPGPPNELKALVEKEVEPLLSKKGTVKESIFSHTIKTIGIGEAAVENKIRSIIDSQTDPTIALYAKTAEVHIRLATKSYSRESAFKTFEPVKEQISGELGKYIYGYDDETIETGLSKLLMKNKVKVACAESCSGGLLGHRLTNVSGSSDYFLGSVVAYSNSMKEKILGVPQDILTKYGAVSEETASAMAKGALELTGADIAISTTGIAGPEGGTPEKPVGTVCFGIATKENQVKAIKRVLIGDREEIKYRTSQAALYFLWREVISQIKD